MTKLSPLLDRFKPSPISQMMGTVARMQADGQKLYDFSTGEPDFDTPAHIKQAAIEAINRGETKYSPTDGTIAVRKAVQHKFARDNNLDFELGQIIVATGAKPLLADIIRTIAGDGDEIVLAAPCWPSHVGMIELAGAEPVFVKASAKDGFIMSPENLSMAITTKTRAVLLCSPSNPTGAVYGEQALGAIAEVLKKHPDIWIITDDLYEHIIYDGIKFHSILEVAPELADRTIVVNGVSKAYAMTGWRIGYAAGPQELMDGVRKVMSQATGCPSSVSQAAGVAALEGPLDCVTAFVETYQSRRDNSVRALNQMPGLSVASPQGAFYLYPSCAGVIGMTRANGEIIKSSSDFADYLLNNFSVAVVPGAAFELDPHFRISTATADLELEEGIAQIGQAIAQLS